ncbi:MAG: ADP-ribosylglycohydrolase family protein, partial [Acidobacteriota bacterium]
MVDTDDNLARALVSLEGLSVGDAFGEQFFTSESQLAHYLESEVAPEGPWHFTDDTNMSLSVVDVLRRFGQINADELATSFARHYDISRGYGPSMNRLLRQIADGHRWEEVSRSQFAGQGSSGNGAAMRSAPVGAYFAEDMALVIQQA